MMPVIRISDATFAVLSTLKTWYGAKTPSEVIDRLASDAREQLGIERDEAQEQVVGASPVEVPVQFDVAPSLAFTKPVSASINGKALAAPRWSSNSSHNDWRS